MPANLDLKAWARWWCRPWEQAHPACLERMCTGRPWLLQALDGGNSPALCSALGIAPSSPPAADPALLGWLMLSTAGRARALGLAAFCLGEYSEIELADDDRRWAADLAKALQPHRWATGEHVSAAALLLAWWAPSGRSRGCLLLPQPPADAEPWAARKLEVFWGSLLWRAVQREVTDAGT